MEFQAHNMRRQFSSIFVRPKHFRTAGRILEKNVRRCNFIEKITKTLKIERSAYDFLVIDQVNILLFLTHFTL